jgi:hypothetical protein
LEYILGYFWQVNRSSWKWPSCWLKQVQNLLENILIKNWLLLYFCGHLIYCTSKTQRYGLACYESTSRMKPREWDKMFLLLSEIKERCCSKFQFSVWTFKMFGVSPHYSKWITTISPSRNKPYGAYSLLRIWYLLTRRTNLPAPPPRIEPGSSFPRQKEPAIWSHPKPTKASPYHHILFL